MQDVIFGLVGGLGLFLFGMKYLSDGLQKIAGARLRRTLRSLTQNRLRGVLLGTFVTSLIQSSSVTTVMLVGLVNAGIVSLTQAASVVIGANIGTTITAQIIAFKVAKYGWPAIGAGVAMMLLSRRRRAQFWGQIVLSFGMVFVGLVTMSDVMKPLKDIPEVTHFFVSLSGTPLLTILLGVVFTVAVQSSSASIGMVLALASTGLIDFRTALFLVVGDNIGTTVTAWLASIGGTVSARRMACFHTLFNVVGAVYFYFLIQSGLYVRFIDFITPGALTTGTISRHIANAHSCFNIFNALVFMIILTPMVKLVQILIPGKDIYVSTDFKYLQERLLSTPEIAIDSSKKELTAMADMVRKTIKTAVDGFFARDARSIPYVQSQESAINHLQHDITYYLAKLASQALTPQLARQLPPLLHSINDLERISDHAVNISELTEKLQSQGFTFSNKALAEMRTLYAKVEDIFEETIRAVRDEDRFAADRVMRYEGEVNLLHRQYLEDHSQRLCEQKCEPMNALVFVDFINNLEKMADHLTNIAQASRRSFEFGNSDEDSD